MLSTIIPASRLSLPTGRNITVTTIPDFYGDDDTATAHHLTLIRSLLSAPDPLTWRHVAPDASGTLRAFTFDGITVKRSAPFYSDDDTGASDDTAPQVNADGTQSDREKYVRRIIGKAMGFKGVTDWTAAGCPVDGPTMIAGGIKAKKVDSLLSELAAYGTTAGVAMVGAFHGTRDTGRRDHVGSHNN